jgi:hypothetical protein
MAEMMLTNSIQHRAVDPILTRTALHPIRIKIVHVAWRFQTGTRAMNKFRNYSVGAALLAVMVNSGAFAASQGTLGSTSTGSLSISASVPSRIQLTGLTDVAFTNQDPSTAASNAQNLCVWANTSTKGYNVTATGSGTSGAFTLDNGATTVPYSVEWSASSGAVSGSALAAGAALTGLVSTATNPTCSAGPASSASLIV